MKKSEKNEMAAFEAAMQELDEILDKMSGRDVPLQQSIALYARAADLIRENDERLRKAQVQIREIDEKIEELVRTEE